MECGSECVMRGGSTERPNVNAEDEVHEDDQAHSAMMSVLHSQTCLDRPSISFERALELKRNFQVPSRAWPTVSRLLSLASDHLAPGTWHLHIYYGTQRRPRNRPKK
jgi:hypothetical protein